MQPPVRTFSNRGRLSIFLFCIVSCWISCTTLNPSSPCIGIQPGGLSTVTYEVIMAPMADHASPGRVEQQHLRDFSTSRTGGRFFPSRVRCGNASITGQDGSMLPKPNQFFVTVWTHHALSRRIEEEDQGKLSTPRASDRLRMSSGFIGVVQHHGSYLHLTHAHERRLSFLWPYRWRFGSPQRQPHLFPSTP